MGWERECRLGIDGMTAQEKDAWFEVRALVARVGKPEAPSATPVIADVADQPSANGATPGSHMLTPEKRRAVVKAALRILNERAASRECEAGEAPADCEVGEGGLTAPKPTTSSAK